MSPINVSSTQQPQATQQPVQNSSKNLDTVLRVAGVALAALAVGAVLMQLPGELVVSGVILIGFVALTCLCIAAISNLPSTGSSVIYTSSYRHRPWTLFRSDNPVYYRPPAILPRPVITLPSYRPAPVPACGNPGPMREPVGGYRPVPAPVSFRPAPMFTRGIDPRPMREPVGFRR